MTQEKFKYAGILKEDGSIHLTKPFETVQEAKREGARLWGVRCDVVELNDNDEWSRNIGVYEVTRYVPVAA